jgi:hypothetical protein
LRVEEVRMPEVPHDVLNAARWAAGFSTVPEPPEEWSGEPHDVTEDPPPGLREEPYNKVAQAGAHAELWEETLGTMEGSARDWFSALKEALDDLARTLDASGLTRRP